MPAAATEILPEIMRSFSQKYPQVRYEVFTSTADIIRERIDKGILDIGLLTEPVDLSRYDFLRLKTKDRWGVLTWREGIRTGREGQSHDGRPEGGVHAGAQETGGTE